LRNYRDLEVWGKTHKLTLQLYLRSRSFPKEEFYGLTSQLRRSAMSIGANLAEGCGRQTTPELARFVRIAMGSASELDYHLLLAHDFGYLQAEDHKGLSQELPEFARCWPRCLRHWNLERSRRPLEQAEAAKYKAITDRDSSRLCMLDQEPKAESQEPAALVTFVAAA
jgi:four helix bundle protein